MTKPTHLTRNDEAEAAVLGAIMLRDGAVDEARSVVDPDDFYDPGRRATYSAMLGLAKDGVPIDVVTVETRLRATDELGLIGGLEGIGRLADKHPSSYNVETHAALVREAAKRRALVAAAGQIIEAARQDGDQRAGEIAEEWTGKIARLADGGRRLYTGGELAQMAVDQGVSRMRGEKKHQPLSTGLTALDEAIGGGLEPGTVTIIAARPGNGKTALMTCMQLTMGRAAEPVYGLQMDMGRVQVGRRLIGAFAPLNLSTIKHPKRPSSVDEMVAAQEGIAGLPLSFDTRKCTAREARAQIREWRRKHPQKTGAAFIDYLQLHRAEKAHGERHDLDLADWVGEYKDLAEELELPIVVASQLNRKVEDRDDKRPRKSDLRDAGQLEEIADVILGLYREAYYDNNADKLAAEILVLKHRDEATRTGDHSVKVRFEPYYTRYLDAPEGQEERDAEQQERKKTRKHRSPHRYAENPD